MTETCSNLEVIKIILVSIHAGEDGLNAWLVNCIAQGFLF